MRAAEAGPSGPDAAGAPAPAPPSTRPAPADGDSLQSLAATLRSSVDDLFSTHVERASPAPRPRAVHRSPPPPPPRTL